MSRKVHRLRQRESRLVPHVVRELPSRATPPPHSRMVTNDDIRVRPPPRHKRPNLTSFFRLTRGSNSRSVPNSARILTLLLLACQLTRSSLRYSIHISAATMRLASDFLMVHASDPYVITGHTKACRMSNFIFFGLRDPSKWALDLTCSFFP